MTARKQTNEGTYIMRKAQAIKNQFKATTHAMADKAIAKPSHSPMTLALKTSETHGTHHSKDVHKANEATKSLKVRKSCQTPLKARKPQKPETGPNKTRHPLNLRSEHCYHEVVVVVP